MFAGFVVQLKSTSKAGPVWLTRCVESGAAPKLRGGRTAKYPGAHVSLILTHPPTQCFFD